MVLAQQDRARGEMIEKMKKWNALKIEESSSIDPEAKQPKVEPKVERKVVRMEAMILLRTWNGHRNRLQGGRLVVHPGVLQMTRLGGLRGGLLSPLQASHQSHHHLQQPRRSCSHRNGGTSTD